MNQHLMQAIAAARAGKKPQAKVLLARVIKDEPENVNAWFLLSSLADTEEQKIQHLQKVLELEPDHQAASEQLAELAPMAPEPVVEAMHDFAAESPEFLPEDDATPDMFPLPQVEMGAGDAPEDPDEAMAWLERLAADQGANLDELPSLFQSEEAEAAEAPAEEEQFPWLDDDSLELDDFLEAMPGTLEEPPQSEAKEMEEPARTLQVSEDFDFVTQSRGDSIPSWLAGEEGYIAADTVITGAPGETEEQAEPENLPDWLNDESIEGWVGDEGEKSGQVVWKPGEGDESRKPTPPPAKKTTRPAAKRQTAASSSSNNLYIMLLALVAVVLAAAILFLLFTQLL